MKVFETPLPNDSGWIQMNDGRYTQASPLIVPADTRTILQINPVSFVDFEAFDGAQNLVDTNGDIDVLNVGDAYRHIILFKADVTANETSIDWQLDIDGIFDVIRIFPNDEYNRGAKLYQDRSVGWEYYQGSTFQANKGEVYIQSTDLVRLYDFVYIFYLLHKGKGSGGA